MKQIILSVIFLLSAIGLFFGVTTKVLDKISALGAERASLQDVLTRFKDISKAKNDLIDAYNSVSEENITRFNKVVPANASEGDLLVAFERMSKSNGLLLKTIEIKPVAKQDTGILIVQEDQYDTVAISATLDGSYDSLKSFLGDLEKSLRVTDISSFSFHVGENATTYEYSLEARAYLKKQPKQTI
jgi:Tfp pilus assembly protein PilO